MKYSHLLFILSLLGACLLFSACQSTPQTHYVLYKSNQLPSPIPEKTYKVEIPDKGEKSMIDPNSQEYLMTIRYLESTLRLQGWSFSERPAYTISFRCQGHDGVQIPADYKGSSTRKQAFIRIGGSNPAPLENTTGPEAQVPDLWKQRESLYTKQMIFSIRDREGQSVYQADACAIDDRRDFSVIPVLLGTILRNFPEDKGNHSSRFQGPTPRIMNSQTAGNK